MTVEHSITVTVSEKHTKV